jgi:glucose-6-phosphate isomerase
VLRAGLLVSRPFHIMTLPFEPAARTSDTLLHDHAVRRIWERDISVWGAAAGTADARSIETRLGWLDIARTMEPELPRVLALGEAARAEGVRAVYLLGMGGSSLCAEVLSSVFGIADGCPELFVLDTTDEQTIVNAASRMDPQATWFLVSSKSGGTVEVLSMEGFFWERMTAALASAAGRHFVAITDPGTSLAALAARRGYRDVFVNPPDIGGRFSALSLFGLVPAALIGAPVKEIVTGGRVMAEGCRQQNSANAGLELGAFIGAAVRAGREKLTIALSPRLTSLGLWIEQLIAESTGKHGTGALPVVDEPLGRPDAYGTDRAFVAIATDVDEPDAARLHAIEKAGHPLLRLSIRVDGLGAEFFRWEFATAIAGAVLRINPFDEPNVAEAKDKTKALLAAYSKDGGLPEPAAAAQDDSVLVFSRRFAGSSPAAVIRAAVASLAPKDYAAFLSYLPADSDVYSALLEVREAIRSRTRAATTFGVGPRYLHSTGQYHKGGPNRTLAFVITADDATRTMIPGGGSTFAVLKRAQALGDVETLDAHDRRTVRIHVKDPARAAAAIERLFADALK